MSEALATMPELEPQLPQSAWSISQPRIRTGDWLDESRRSLRGTVRSAPIWHVRQQQRCLRLAQPLMVRVRQDEDFFFAENETLRIVGTGTNTEEALVDFSMHLMHFHQYYTKISAGQLTGEAKELKRLYQRIFVEEG